MRVFTTLPQEDLRKVASAARAIEAEGYDGVASMENKHDPFLALAVAGRRPSGSSCIPASRLPSRARRWRSRMSAGTWPDLQGAASSWDWVPRWGAQRAALFGAMDAAGAAHARICPGVARDLALLENRRKTELRGPALPVHLDDPEFRTRADCRSATGGDDRRSRPGDAKSSGRGM